MTTMSKSPTRKGGRPSKPTDEKRTRVVTIKLTDAEHADLKKRSKDAGVKLAEYVRHGAFRLTIVRGILNLSSDFNQAMTCFHQLKLRSATNKLAAVVDRMFDILKKLKPNKETDYVCKNP